MIGSSDRSGARNPQSEDAAGAAGPSIDPADVARFSAQAAEWWDPRGPFAPLHRFNPARLAFLRDRFAERFVREARARAAFEGLTLIDVGCGGGLIAEPMRRLGFAVTGVDASAENVGTARAHAETMGLEITYRAAKAGIMTGILLAVARISGETAPLLFTALNNQFWSMDLNKPMANLPVVIFQFAMSPYADWQRLAWGGAALITFAVLLLNIFARTWFRQRS